jgi:cytochrome P450
MHFRRTATEDFEIGGKTIKKGDKILLWYLSGNRDEEVFEDPYTFSVLRDPNPHMTFGAGGPHFCLGFSLAQLEIRVMFEELLRRFPDMELAGPIQRLHSNFIRGIRHMPVTFTPERL